MRRFLTMIFAAAAGLAALPGIAEEMPAPEDLRLRMAAPPAEVTVYEPHLGEGGRNVARTYLGYPAETVISALLGADWRQQADEIEFRALDGYVSRIPAARFQPGKAFLVFALADGAPFTVDNPAQNQQDVPLGPYYLVWENIADAQRRAEGAHGWPYQVAEMLLYNGSDAALLPPGLDGRYREAAGLAKTHCLSCHMINGHGGEKYPGNLAEIAKGFAMPDFVAWVLNPSASRPRSTMPALSFRLPESERVRIAQALHAYLQAVPVLE